MSVIEAAATFAEDDEGDAQTHDPEDDDVRETVEENACVDDDGVVVGEGDCTILFSNYYRIGSTSIFYYFTLVIHNCLCIASHIFSVIVTIAPAGIP